MSDFPIDTVFAALAARLGERTSRAKAVVAAHGASESYHAAHPPDIVVFPQSTDEVAAIVTICAAHGAPIVPWGAGTSLEGNASAIRGGVCIDFAQMNRLLALNAEDLDCRVQPGITASGSMPSCATPACSSRSIPAPTPRSAA